VDETTRDNWCTPDRRKGVPLQTAEHCLCPVLIASNLGAQPTPAIFPNGLVNGATGVGSASVPVAARGSIVTIYGSTLSNTIASSATSPLPTQLGGTQVFFGGVAAPLLYVSPNQLNVQVPFEIPDVTTSDVVVQNGSGPSPPENHDPGTGSRNLRSVRYLR
jgi:hypothetical protein